MNLNRHPELVEGQTQKRITQNTKHKNMKYTTIIGILLIAIAIVASFVGKVKFTDLLTQPEFVLGLLYGGGLGMLIGGIIGWLYKKRNKIETTKTTKAQQTTPPTGSHNL